ncbi:hypothetical protein TSAR_001615 [Trichomalopsis sarcophagae]|uniref:Uncharacterized protein n=1 Tax=Trichomalopsis sarcophagae TaxID=543379 RepID=A0A232FA81_9HYME|nr:hypothetical protein TSAR_001615 [Trichomalopsis sarcophagae]
MSCIFHLTKEFCNQCSMSTLLWVTLTRRRCLPTIHSGHSKQLFLPLKENPKYGIASILSSVLDLRARWAVQINMPFREFWYVNENQ